MSEDQRSEGLGAEGAGETTKPKRLGTFESLIHSATSWRTLSVALLSFSSGLPLGLVWLAIPDWLRDVGVDIRIVGLITLAQAPWTFKFLWSPLMDRYSPPFGGRRRGWMIIAQVALFGFTLWLAGVGHVPEAPWVVGALALAIAFASATQDIAIDAYAVDVLRTEEQGVVVGARIAVYRAAMFVAGGLAITLAGQWSWPAVNVGLACLYLPMTIIAWKAPNPEKGIAAPGSIKEAVWYPFLGFLSRHRALEILAFVMFYKLADNLAQTLQRPFLVDMGYSDIDRGVALSTIGLVGTLAGTFIGGALTNVMGLGRSLWVFGALQIFSNVGYAVLAMVGEVNRPLMYGAIGFETFSSGLGTGAFSVLLLRMTQKRFSATQYALFSSLFGLPRLIAGPIAGFSVYAVGWTTFFWSTLVAGIPGMLLLARFVPINVREPRFEVKPPVDRGPMRRGELARKGLLGFLIGSVSAAMVMAVLTALRAMREAGEAGQPVIFDLVTPLAGLFQPTSGAEWLSLFGLLTFGVVCGLLTAAVVAARHGAGRELALAEGDEASES
jgi:PAT family beta-lactamase induction signal transducer AmpG